MNCFGTCLKYFREGRKAILDQVHAKPSIQPEIHNPYGGSSNEGTWWYLGAINALRRISILKAS